MATKRYNPRAITFSWAALNITGYIGDGDHIELERRSDGTQSSVGAGGEVTVETINDKRMLVRLRLQRSHKDNGKLSAIHQVQQETGDVLIAPMAVKDESGSDLHVAPEAWIMRAPDPVYGQQSGQLEWVFEAANMKSYSGGN